jgi:hypothetical protein
MEAYDTLSEAVTALQQQGYTEDFNIHNNILKSGSGQHEFKHTEFIIDKSFRFDEKTRLIRRCCMRFHLPIVR